MFLRENRGVPIGYVLNRLQKLNQLPKPTPDRADGTEFAGLARVADQRGAQEEPATVAWTIPLQISVTLGTPAGSGPPALIAVATGGEHPSKGESEPKSLRRAVGEARDRLAGRPEVLTVREGYLFRNGWITPEEAVVVVLKDPAPLSPEDLGLPARVLGFPVDVRAASPWDVAEALERLEVLEGLPRTTYDRSRAKIKLEEVHQKMKVVCHVSPDAGWPILREFLQETQARLTVGMYDFTALYIIDEVLDAVKDHPRRLILVMQAGAALTGKKVDIPEEQTLAKYKAALGERFDHAPASVGAGRQFASAYHIKVAVRDGKAFWLSSGNWQSSNQPNHELAVGGTSWDLLTGYNREWHAVIENTRLARQFEQFIEYDLKNAKADAVTEASLPPTEFFLIDEAIEERVWAGADLLPPATDQPEGPGPAAPDPGQLPSACPGPDQYRRATAVVPEPVPRPSRRRQERRPLRRLGRRPAGETGRRGGRPDHHAR